MMWLTWRQHRLQLLGGAIGLAVIAAFLLLTHPGIAGTFDRMRLPSCFAAGRDCTDTANTFDRRYASLQFLIPLFLVAPLLIGLFWGAPLVAREIEQGTHRLVWTQGVTRQRWFTSRTALIAATAIAGSAALAALVTWWSAMFVQAGDDRLSPGVFDIRGVVPVAYTIFALALGVLAGSVIRKTLPAMAATLGGYIGVRAAVVAFVRPQYMAARTLSFGMFGAQPRPFAGDWVLRTVTLDRAGRVIAPRQQLDFNYLSPRCPGLIPTPGTFPSKDAVAACIQRLGIHASMTYQPGSRFWAFQGIESAVFLALAAALVTAAVFVVRRRIA